MLNIFAKRNTNIDIIRILATLMIVMAHITATVYERPDFFGGTAWWISFITITVSRLGVPLFFMISGYLLTYKKRALRESLEHAWRRLLIPCFVWSLLTYAGLYVSQKIITKPSWDMFFAGFGTAYYFLIGLSVLYVLNPIFQKIVSKASRQEVETVLVVLALTTVGETLYRFYTDNTGVNIFSYWVLALFYFLYGQYTAIYGRKEKGGRQALVFGSALLINLLLIYGERVSGNWDELVWESYFGPTVLAASMGLFRQLLQIDSSRLKVVNKVIAKVAGLCFGIYLSHGIILDILLHKTNINPYGEVKINLLIFLMSITVLTLVASGLVSFLLGKNKNTKLILGQ